MRRLIQFLALMVLLLLVFAGRIQIWMVVFAGSILLAVKWGRIYCGYICPIATSMDLVRAMGKRLGLRHRPVPKWVKHPGVRWGLVVLFVVASVLMMRSGLQVPVKLILIALASALTLRYVPAFWHHYLCPYGTLLSLPSALTKAKYQLDDSLCNSCGLCMTACPGEAIRRTEKRSAPTIDPSHCLLCGECVQVCPLHAINQK